MSIINKLNISREQKEQIVGKIFAYFIGKDFKIYKTDDENILTRIVLKSDKITTVIDYILNMDNDNWIVEEWECLLDNALVDEIIFESRELKGYARNKNFECSCISPISNEDIGQDVYRLTLDDFYCVLEDNFPEEDIKMARKFINDGGDIARLIHDGMSQTWYEDMYCVATNIIDTLREREASCKA